MTLSVVKDVVVQLLPHIADAVCQPVQSIGDDCMILPIFLPEP